MFMLICVVFHAEITVCVRPLYGKINVINLLEFIAYYRANQVTTIALYHYDYDKTNFSIRSQKIMSFLQDIPGVSFHPLRLPIHLHRSLHAGGQIVAEHDCLLRYSHSVQAHIDIDEFISIRSSQSQPIQLKHWIMDQLDQATGYVSLSVANAFHCHEFNLKSSKYYEFQLLKSSEVNETFSLYQKNLIDFYKNLNESSASSVLMTVNNHFVQSTTWSHTLRSKMILLRPQLVRVLGVHNVWHHHERVLDSAVLSMFRPFLLVLGQGRFTLDHSNRSIVLFSNLDLSPGQVVLRHYRWCCGIEQTYLAQLLSFYTVRDKSVNVSRVMFPSLDNYGDDLVVGSSRNDLNRSLLHTNEPVKSMETFVLNQFRRYLALINGF